MQVEIAFLPDDETLIAENDISAAYATDPASRPAPDQAMGVLTFRNDGTQFMIADPLLWMVPTLCFDRMAEMLEQGQATFDFWEVDDTLSLRRDGGTVEMATEHRDPVQFPTLPLAQAMFDAGSRYLDLLDALWPGDDFLQMDVFRAQADKAKKVLDAAS